MAEPKREQLKVHEQRAILVSVISSNEKAFQDRALAEIRGLAETAGAKIVGEVTQIRERPDPATFIGKGKLEEVCQLIPIVDAKILLFDGHLSPAQGKALEEETKIQVVDRSEVILDIFATHARTYESKLQVELAQLLYMRPRLTRMWTHLERIEGGIGSGRGPGEKQLETDRRLVDKRVAELQRKLKEVQKQRERQVESRREHQSVSIVGYTNAGKSTLMNALTGADVYVANKLFATLETRTRRWKIPHWGELLLSDTVGFIRNLPHHLVASFRSTLEETRHADLLLHVVDASDPDAFRQIETVEEVLGELGVDSEQPILVLNKIDAVVDQSYVDVLRAKYPRSIAVSAFTRQGLDVLSAAVAARLGDGYVDAIITGDVGDGKLFAYLAEHSEVFETTYSENRVNYRCRVPKRFFHGISGDNIEVSLETQPAEAI